MKKFTIISLMLLLVLGACSKPTEKAQANEPLTAVLTITPEIVKPQETATFELLVREGNKILTSKLDKIQLEVWSDADQKHEALKLEEGKNGKFTSTYKFGNEEKYYVMFRVKSGKKIYEETTRILLENSSVNSSNTEHTDAAGDHNHNDTDTKTLSFHFMNENNGNLPETKLLTHITKDAKPFAGARVVFEIMKDNQVIKKLEAVESKQGEYSVNTTLNKGQNYIVKITAEKDTISETHQENFSY